MALALSAELPAAGDYLTLQMTEPGVLLVRQADGMVGAFLNRCRHRRRPVVIEAHGEGAGGFICPFHAWRYGLDGDLSYAPKHDWPEGNGWPGLHRLPVIEADGLILAAPAPDATAAAIQQGPAAAMQALRGLGLAGDARVTRASVRTEAPLPTVMSLAADLLARDARICLSNEPAARTYASTDVGTPELILLAPGTLIAKDGDTTLIRARVLRRGGCEMQVVGFGGTANQSGDHPADRLAHVLQKTDGDTEIDPAQAAVANAFALPVA